jgi:hypothetical protein
MSLLDRVKAELERRREPPTELQVALQYLRTDEIRTLRDAVEEQPLDTEMVAKMERRARIRQKLGLRVFDRNDPTFVPDAWAIRPCNAPAHGDCRCTDQALDTRRIGTRLGLEYHARQIHAKLHPPVIVSDQAPDESPEWAARRLADVLPFRRRKEAPPAPMEPESPELDPMLAERVPLESLGQLAELLHLPYSEGRTR